MTAVSPWSGEKGKQLGAAALVGKQPFGVSHTGLWVYQITRS